MTTEVIYVQAVTPRRTSAGEKFDVTAKLKPGERWAPLFETFDALQASLAERAAEQRFPVRVTWRQTAWGRELERIERADRPQAVAS